MKKFKTEDGITLISLSVTIIVLVILAGVTISYLVGDNGFVKQAEGIEANAIAAEQEAQEQINALKSEEKYTEDGVVILEDETSPIVNSFDITEIELNAPKSSFRVSVNVTEAESGIDKIEYSADGGTTYVMPIENSTAKTYKFENLQYNEQYNVKVKITDKNGNETIVSEVVYNIKIGDYVNYTYDTVADGYSLLGTQSGYDSDQTVAQSSTTLKWRVLNIDEDTGKIDLVSSEPSDNIVYFKGALGYNNGVYLLNNMCAKLYSNTSLGVTARSINLADMEKHLTTDGIAARNSYKSSTDTVYGSTYKYTSYIYYPNLYKNQIGQGIDLVDGATVTQPDLNGIDPYNESDSYYSTPTTETYTQASTSLTITQTYYNIPINEANYGDAASVLSNSNYYWVASHYVDTYSSSSADFGLRYASAYMNGISMFSSYGFSNYGSVRLRPVVSLSSILLDGTKDADGVWQLK